MQTLRDMLNRAETGEQAAQVCLLEAQAIALGATRGYTPDQITDVHLADDGTLASITCGQDADGMARCVLNFAL